MPLLTSVIVRGINNLSDARYCAGMGADYLTFRLDPTLPGAVTPDLVQELSSWVAGVQLVGEFGPMAPEQINALAQQCGLQAVLLHGSRQSEEMEEYSVPVMVLIDEVPKLPSADLDNRFRTLAPSVAGFVLAGSPPQPFTDTEVAALSHLAHTYPIWLAPGFAPGSVRELIAAIEPSGLVLEGGDEIRPGLRDFSEMEAVFEELEVD